MTSKPVIPALYVLQLELSDSTTTMKSNQIVTIAVTCLVKALLSFAFATCCAWNLCL